MGVEIGLTVQALRAGFCVIEVPTAMTHRITGRSAADIRHRAAQFLSAAGVLLRLWLFKGKAEVRRQKTEDRREEMEGKREEEKEAAENQKTRKPEKEEGKGNKESRKAGNEEAIENRKSKIENPLTPSQTERGPK